MAAVTPFIHPESSEIVEYIPEEQAEGDAHAGRMSEVESISEEDYAGLNRGKETVTVKYLGTNQRDNSQIRGELVEIKSDNTTELNSF